MSAPALIALAHGSRDPRSAATITALVDEVRALRPDLPIEAAFLELSKPSFETVVNKLVRKGHDEIVVVPLSCRMPTMPRSTCPRRSRPRWPSTRV